MPESKPNKTRRGSNRLRGVVTLLCRSFIFAYNLITSPVKWFRSASVPIRAAVIIASGGIVTAIILSPIGNEICRELFDRHRVTIQVTIWNSGAGHPGSDTLVTFGSNEGICAPGDAGSGALSKLFLSFNLVSLPRNPYVEHAELHIPFRTEGQLGRFGRLRLRSLNYSEYSIKVFTKYPWDRGFVDRGSAVSLYWRQPPEGRGVIKSSHSDLARLVEDHAGSSIELCLFFEADFVLRGYPPSGYCVTSLPELRIQYLEGTMKR